MDKWNKTLELYDKLVGMQKNFERKGKTVPYTSANGYMFSLINKEGQLGIRLPKAKGLKFVEEYKTTPFKSHGAVMKDYVTIPDALLKDLPLLLEYLQQGYKHVMSLEPK